MRRNQRYRRIEEDKGRREQDREDSDCLIDVFLPDISSSDCEADSEFKHMFQYLETQELSGDDKVDRTILLSNDQFILQDRQMYRIDTPKRKALAKLVQLRKRLCVPKNIVTR